MEKDNIEDLKNLNGLNEVEVLEKINEILPRLPKMIGSFAGIIFFVIASLIQVFINAFVRPQSTVTFFDLGIALIISYTVAFLGGFLVMRKAKRRMKQKLEGKKIIDHKKIILKY